jgi:hypothetical protein
MHRWTDKLRRRAAGGAAGKKVGGGDVHAYPVRKGEAKRRKGQMQRGDADP